MPYRAMQTPPTFAADSFMKLVCTVDLSALPRDRPTGVNLGTGGGQPAVYLNGQKRLLLDRTRHMAELPLMDDELRPSTEIVIVSRKDTETRFPGLGSLIPMSYGVGQEQAA